MITMISHATIHHVRSLLEELRVILESEGEANWLRGVDAALGSLGDADDEQGYIEARSIYITMTGAKDGLSDYYIQRSDFAEQVAANRRLDDVRDELWRAFQAG